MGLQKHFPIQHAGQLNPDNEICWEKCIQSECTEECQKKKDIDNIQKYYNTTNAVKICTEHIDNTTTRCYIADWVNTTKADMTLHKNSASLYFSVFVVYCISASLSNIFQFGFSFKRLSMYVFEDLLIKQLILSSIQLLSLVP